ncbi:hypothetical protein [Aneurinibacillus sp. REN35]
MNLESGDLPVCQVDHMPSGIKECGGIGRTIFCYGHNMPAFLAEAGFLF